MSIATRRTVEADAWVPSPPSPRLPRLTMLSLAELVALERSLRRTPVLTVYLEEIDSDPAKQESRRVRLDHALEAVREHLVGASHDEHEALTRCVQTLEREVGLRQRLARGTGWAAFITSDGIRHAASLPTHSSTLVVWTRGAFIAPYLRAAHDSHPVVLVVVDARKADVYRYQASELTEVATLRAHDVLKPLAHMGDAPRPGFHSGTRGIAGRDAAQRSRRAGMTRMLRELAEQVRSTAGDDAWVVIGGITRVVSHAVRALQLPAPRVLTLAALDVHSTPAQLAAVASAAATTLRDASLESQLDDLETNVAAGTLAVMGRPRVLSALRLACVRALFMSDRWVVEHPRDAARLVRRAIDQGASVEAVAREPGLRLDTFGGVAAALRYRPAELTRSESDSALAAAPPAG